jgi:hypothetical protein
LAETEQGGLSGGQDLEEDHDLFTGMEGGGPGDAVGTSVQLSSGEGQVEDGGFCLAFEYLEDFQGHIGEDRDGPGSIGGLGGENSAADDAICLLGQVGFIEEYQGGGGTVPRKHSESQKQGKQKTHEVLSTYRISLK